MSPSKKYRNTVVLCISHAWILGILFYILVTQRGLDPLPIPIENLVTSLWPWLAFAWFPLWIYFLCHYGVTNSKSAGPFMLRLFLPLLMGGIVLVPAIFYWLFLGAIAHSGSHL